MLKVLVHKFKDWSVFNLSDLNNLAKAIIHFQERTSMSDAQFAFSSHFSVERIHDLKSGEKQATSEETDKLMKFMNSN
jgi:hypothetical protein